MKRSSPSSSAARIAGLILQLAAAPLATAALTGVQPPFSVSWTQVVDSTTPALNSAGVPLGINYSRFDPPVISQWSGSLAFKARLAAPALPSDDEGVWRTQGHFGSPLMALREGDTFPGSGTRTFGYLGNLNVQNLQCGANNWLACATNTSVPGGRVGIGYNLTLHNLGESPTAAWSDIRPPVITNMGNPFATTGDFAMWKKTGLGAKPSGVEHISAPLFVPPLSASWATGLSAPFGPWKNDQPPRVGSPSISENGWVAAFARDAAAWPNHIRLTDRTVSSSRVIVRQNDPVVPPVPGYTVPGSTFGIFHSQLMANSDAITAGFELVAWQMQTMATPLNTNTSLWCQRGTARHCLAFATQPAPDLPAGYSYKSFYELQAVPSNTPDSHWVFWGAILNTGHTAIYRAHIGPIASPPDLIATDVPSTAWVGLISGGLHSISKLDKFFSVNVFGELFFSASCATAPPGQERILVTAKVSDNHDRQVRAQSGISLLGFGRLATFFDLAKPAQGQCSRGQAVGTQWFTARILYSGGEGIFWATL